jgi:hypothetical protein
MTNSEQDERYKNSILVKRLIVRTGRKHCPPKKSPASKKTPDFSVAF